MQALAKKMGILFCKKCFVKKIKNVECLFRGHQHALRFVGSAIQINKEKENRKPSRNGFGSCQERGASCQALWCYGLSFFPQAWAVAILLRVGVCALVWRNGGRKHCKASWRHQGHASILGYRYDCSCGTGQEGQHDRGAF